MLRGGLRPWSQTMVSEGARPWGRGRSGDCDLRFSVESLECDSNGTLFCVWSALSQPLETGGVE